MKESLKRVLKWIDNFWYHHKWKTLLTVFFGGVILFCTVHACSKPSYDAHIIYAGPVYYGEELYKEATAKLSGYLPSDFNEDGQKLVDFVNVLYVPEELAEEYMEQGVNFDPYQNEQSLSLFRTEIMNGQCLICLMDPEVYDKMSELNVFRPLAEIFDEVPENAADDYAFLAEDLPAFRRMGESVFPEDTVVCLRVKNSAYGAVNSEWDRVYAFHEELFRKLVSGK